MPSQDERLSRLVRVLVAISALVYLGSFLWKIGAAFADLILLMALAWLAAYVLSPVARWLSRGPVPQFLVGWAGRRWGERAAYRLRTARVPYGVAAVSLYLLALSGLVLVLVVVVPAVIVQLGQLASRVPEFIAKLPQLWEGIQDAIVEQFDVDPETLKKAVPIERFTEELMVGLPDLFGDAATVVQTAANAIANILLVFILSLYIMLDGKRLTEQFNRVIPLRYQGGFEFVFNTISRTFGGFLRGQVLIALSQGVFTAIAMTVFGQQFTIVTSILSGLVMFIPELGAPLAMFAPAVVSALQGSDATFPLLIMNFIFQQILLQFLMPRFMSEAIGMPSLLVLISVLVGGRALGLWGVLFSIPVAGVLYTIVIVMLEQMKKATDARDLAGSGGATKPESTPSSSTRW